MGSLNDVWICKANGHNVIVSQEPWVNNAFDLLKSICYSLVNSQVVDLSYTIHTEVQGWRCLKCGYSELTESEIDYYISKYLVKDKILNSIKQDHLLESI
jgi:hypothetical protein